MIVKKITLWMLIVLGFSNCRDSESGKNIKVVLDGDEVVWAGVVRDGHLMPFSFPYEFDFSKDNMGNQIQPLLLTNKGRYFWSEKPFSFKISAMNYPKRSTQVCCNRQNRQHIKEAQNILD
jgi:alpha-glucosidase